METFQKINQNHRKFLQKLTKIIRISYIFLKNIKVIEKKVKKKSWHFLDFRSDSEQDPDPDPYKNKTDSKHCFTDLPDPLNMILIHNHTCSFQNC